MAATFETHEVQRPGRSVWVVHRPTSVEAALRLLADRPHRQAIAGGTDLLLDLHRSGSGPPVELVDLSAIAGFDSITDEDDRFVFGGGVRHNQIVGDRRLIQSATPLAQACLEIGSPQLRNRATIAGNLATASPANDTLSALIALDATLELARWESDAIATRTIPVDRFFTGFRATELHPHELIVAIRVPKLAESARGLWVKLGNRRAQAISVIHAAFVLDFDGDEVRAGRMAFGSVAPRVELADASTLLTGSSLDDDSLASIASAVADEFAPIDDVRATAHYRTQMLTTIVVRALSALRDQTHLAAWPPAPPSLGGASGTDLGTGTTETIDDTTELTAIVNGSPITGTGAASTSLLDWLRRQAPPSLEGTKEGCAEGECGACTVELNGAAVMSCLVQAAQAANGTIRTVEGLATDGRLHPIQRGFVEEFAVQCGFCIPGFVVAGACLLDEVPEPTEEQIRLAFSGNLCRCTGYYPMISAVELAATRGEER